MGPTIRRHKLSGDQKKIGLHQVIGVFFAKIGEDQKRSSPVELGVFSVDLLQRPCCSWRGF